MPWPFEILCIFDIRYATKIDFAMLVWIHHAKRFQILCIFTKAPGATLKLEENTAQACNLHCVNFFHAYTVSFCLPKLTHFLGL